MSSQDPAGPQPEPSLPEDVEATHTSAEFTAASVPDALLAEHQTGPGQWAVLEVLDGQLTFVDVTNDAPRPVTVTGPGAVVIPPTRPHKLQIEGEVRFLLRFYRARS
ncbi:MAG: DUF1971 domain-containing protein [Planctomycetota bacterium]